MTEGGWPAALRRTLGRNTDMDWEVYPDGLHDLLVRIGDDYAPPALYITENFGLVYVDYPALERVPKDSFYWYRDFIARNTRETEAAAI